MSETESLDREAEDAIADELLRLADSKLLLGYRHSQWMFSGPSLQACNAVSSISQDEFGHARSLYRTYLDASDDERGELMHERDPTEYRNIPSLDEPSETWTEFVVGSLLVDSAINQMISALEYDSVARMSDKIEQEESFHARYRRAWLKRFTDDEDDREVARATIDETFASVYIWFGPESSRPDDVLVDTDLRPPAAEIRTRWLAAVEETIEEFGFSLPDPPSPDWDAWDETRWRQDDGGPDRPSIEQLRGDQSAAFR